MQDRARLEVSYGLGEPEVVNDEPSGFSQPAAFANTPAVFLAKGPAALSPIINSCRILLGTNVAGRRIGVREAAAARVSPTVSASSVVTRPQAAALSDD